MSKNTNYDKLIERLAISLAKSDGEENLADLLADRRNETPAEESTYVEYIEAVTGMIENAGMKDLLTILSISARTAKDTPTLASDLDEIEEFIAVRERDIFEISRQLDSDQIMQSVDRPEDWRKMAQKALYFKRRDLAFGHRIRLKALRNLTSKTTLEDDLAWDKVLRKEMSGAEFNKSPEVARKLKMRIESLEKINKELEAARAKEKSQRIHLTTRENIGRQTILAYLRIHAPDHVEAALTHCSSVQSEYDQCPQHREEIYRGLKNFEKASILEANKEASCA